MVFHVPIGIANNTEMHDVHTHAPKIEYVQDDKNTCVLSNMDSDLFAVNEHVAENAVMSRLSWYLSCDTVDFMNRINFNIDILTYRVIKKGEQWCHYNLVQWNNKGSFDILNNVGDHVTLFQLEYSAGNVNHAFSITGYSIYYSNYKRALNFMI